MYIGEFPDKKWFTSFHILSLMLRIQASLMSLLSLSHPPEISTWGFGPLARRQEAWPSLPTGHATPSDAPSPPASLVHDYIKWIAPAEVSSWLKLIQNFIRLPTCIYVCIYTTTNPKSVPAQAAAVHLSKVGIPRCPLHTKTLRPRGNQSNVHVPAQAILRVHTHVCESSTRTLCICVKHC